ncbi:MAG: XRE family transcriptional regulator [Clostridia bacterium]|nr:XRE family transcriptional regulator [Clostridia bacterium]
MSIGQNIKRLRESHGMSQLQIAEIAGVTDKAVSTWENDVKIPRMGAIQRLADYFGITKSDIIEDETVQSLNPLLLYPNAIPIRGKRAVPIIGSVACGEPIYNPGDGTEYILAGDDMSCDFALIAEGDSMIGDRIQSGDIVFIRRQDDVDDGSIVAVAIDGELTLKHISRLRNADGHILHTCLTASNPKYPPIIIGGANETREARILGKAVAFRSMLP